VNKYWYALAVQPRRETYVENQLRSLDYRAVCARYFRIVRHARRTQTVLSPLFPGYIFVELAPELQNWRRLNSLPGSVGLVKFDNRPTPLNQCFVESLIENLGPDGVANFRDKLRVGDRVRTIGGLFDQRVGEIVSMAESDRVKVLIGALNRKIETTLPSTAVRLAC